MCKVIGKRRHWPAALLAKVLGCNRAVVYRYFPGRGPIRTEEILRAITDAQYGPDADG